MEDGLARPDPVRGGPAPPTNRPSPPTSPSCSSASDGTGTRNQADSPSLEGHQVARSLAVSCQAANTEPLPSAEPAPTAKTSQALRAVQEALSQVARNQVARSQVARSQVARKAPGGCDSPRNREPRPPHRPRPLFRPVFPHSPRSQFAVHSQGIVNARLSLSTRTPAAVVRDAIAATTTTDMQIKPLTEPVAGQLQHASPTRLQQNYCKVLVCQLGLRAVGVSIWPA